MASESLCDQYSSWFSLADTDRDGRLVGKDAVKFFAKSNLPREKLSKVWSLSDEGAKGYLNISDFVRAMQLISLAQKGETISKELLATHPEAEPPQMDGLDPPNSQNPFGAPAFKDPSTIPRSVSSKPTPPPSAASVKKGARLNMQQCTSIIDGLKKIYAAKVRPIEAMYNFGNFFSPLMTDSDFEAKPSILLLGQYSTGKTTFIKHLLEREYPGCHIGPEPTTDRFFVIEHGHEERRTPGNTLAVQPDRPYQGLSSFGTAFLSKFECSQCPSPLLSEISIVDTPGVLSGEKQRVDRSYDFISVCGWFAARCDLILLLFDPYKLDISDEFKEVIASLRGHDDKIRIVLNKADGVDAQQLMRVYGALMWSLGKVFSAPEVTRVYIGSFNTEPIKLDKNPLAGTLFGAEQADLKKDLFDIPQRSCERKINEFVKRVRAAKIHTLLMGHFRKNMPWMGKKDAQAKLMTNIREEFHKVQREYNLAVGDFPNPDKFKAILSGYDLSKFPKLDKKYISVLDSVLSQELPALLKLFENPFGDAYA